MLKRASTRIELKPEDREEYFAHKRERPPAPQPQSDTTDTKSDKDKEKEVRIGLARTAR